MFRFPVFVLSLSLCLFSGFELHRRYQENHFLMLESAPLNRADTLLAQQRWQEAKYLANVVQHQPELGDAQRAQSIEMAADAALDSVPLQMQAFFSGVISGEASNGPSLMGALMLDLFIIGDIRDLIFQGYKEMAYQDGDEVIMALSATGLGLALLPGLHWAPAILKSLKRAGSLSERFLKMLHKHARTAIDTGDFQPLAKVVADFGSATRSMGVGPVSGAMKAVETEADLHKLASAAAISPKKAYAVSTLIGHRGLKQVHRNGTNISSLSGKMKISSRLVKSMKKSLGAIPVSVITGLFLLGLSLILASLFSRRKHEQRHCQPPQPVS